ncbi:putative 2-acylglycerol O-acyltransferase [Helianthus annuus]|nr:putative 2-acylglycerol O-acyltransferase [Helianthus annuus]
MGGAASLVIHGKDPTFQHGAILAAPMCTESNQVELKLGLFNSTLQFLVLHGEANTMIDPEANRALYKQASNKDQTIKLYPGMRHRLTMGEQSWITLISSLLTSSHVV